MKKPEPTPDELAAILQQQRADIDEVFPPEPPEAGQNQDDDETSNESPVSGL